MTTSRTTSRRTSGTTQTTGCQVAALGGGLGSGLVRRWVGYLAHGGQLVRGVVRQLRQHGRLTRRQRTWAVLGINVVLLLAGAGHAAAADPGGFADAFVVRDSHGLTMSQYALSLGDGGWTGKATGQSLSAWLASTVWDVYLIAVSVSVWVLHNALSFAWMDVLRPPFELVAGTLHQLIEGAGLVPAAMTMAAVLAGVWLLRGRAGAALGEFVHAAVMGALFFGVLANPVATITGPNGLLTRSQQLATETASQIMSAGQMNGTGPLNPHAPAPTAGPGSARSPQVQFAATEGPNSRTGAQQAKVEARTIEIFVRIPHQIINYGSVIDGRDAKCAQVYDTVLAKGPWGDDSEPRDRMGDCNSKYGDAAQRSSQALSSTFVLLPSGAFLVLFLFVLVLLLVLTGLLILFEACRLTLDAARAVLPGQARTALWQNLVGMLAAMATNVVLVAFTAIYLQLLSAVFESHRWNPQQTFVLVDVLLLVATIFLVVWTVRARKKGRQAGQRAAAALSPRAVSAPTKRPITAMISGAAMLASRQRPLQRAMGTTSGRTSTRHRARTDTTGARSGTARSGPLSSRARTLGKVVSFGLAATVGAPVAAPRAVAAARAGMSARRAALSARIAAARQGASAYGQEYVSNVAAAGRFAGTVTGARWAASHTATATAAPRVRTVLAGSLAAGATRRPQPHPQPGQRPPAAHAPRPGAQPLTPSAKNSAKGAAAPSATPSATPPSARGRATTSKGGAPRTTPGGPRRTRSLGASAAGGPAAVPVAPAGVPTSVSSPPMASPRERLTARLNAEREASTTAASAPPGQARRGRGKGPAPTRRRG